jgi:hypothetical protein
MEGFLFSVTVYYTLLQPENLLFYLIHLNNMMEPESTSFRSLMLCHLTSSNDFIHNGSHSLHRECKLEKSQPSEEKWIEKRNGAHGAES